MRMLVRRRPQPESYKSSSTSTPLSAICAVGAKTVVSSDAEPSLYPLITLGDEYGRQRPSDVRRSLDRTSPPKLALVPCFLAGAPTPQSVLAAHSEKFRLPAAAHCTRRDRCMDLRRRVYRLPPVAAPSR
jgi:hypothetical protein